jgi:lipopolysaccharide biosynthesis regulator YciM
MALRWLAILILLVAAFIGYLASLNPVPVKVVLPFLGQYNPTSGLLMILSFSIGILCTLVFFAVRDWKDYFRKMASRKRDKLSDQAREKLQRSRNYREIGLPDPAVAALRDALEKDPALAEAHDLMGEILAERTDFYGAAASHSQALTLDLSNEAYRWKLAMDYHHAGNPAMADKTLKDGLESGEKSTYLFVRYRDLLMEKRDWDGAIAVQNRLMKSREYKNRDESRQLLAGLHFEKGKLLIAEKQVEEAIRAFEEASKLDPQLSAAYVSIGDGFLSQDKEKSALKIWALGYRRTSDLAILSRLEEYYLQHDDPSRIINLYLRYIEEKPEEAPLRLQFAHLLLKLEMHQEAQNQLEEVRRRLSEENPQVAYLSYQLRQKMDDPKGALGELANLVEHHCPVKDELVCSQCGRRVADALDRCPGCGRWGSLRKTL